MAQDSEGTCDSLSNQRGIRSLRLPGAESPVLRVTRAIAQAAALTSLSAVPSRPWAPGLSLRGPRVGLRLQRAHGRLAG